MRKMIRRLSVFNATVDTAVSFILKQVVEISSLLVKLATLLVIGKLMWVDVSVISFFSKDFLLTFTIPHYGDVSLNTLTIILLFIACCAICLYQERDRGQ